MSNPLVARHGLIVRCLSILNVHFCKKSPKLAQMIFDLHKSKMATVKIGMVVYVLALWSSYLDYGIQECRVGI